MLPKKPDMIFDDMAKYLPNHWYPMDSGEARYLVIPVPPYSTEFEEVMQRFKGDYYCKITGLYKVQNPLMYTKFALKQHDYSQRGPFTIKQLYHDTSDRNIHSISEFNFDWKCGTRFMFGPGVYFSISPDIASKHSSKSNGINRAMFLVDVLVQNVEYGDERTFLPNPGCDTVVAHGGVTYVKYFDCEYYPAYVVSYMSRRNPNFMYFN
ncbi:protein mono-ADP-ribosyltransferase PARP12-like [Cylas formicarius]|uniref:protein mono-ADP-ribosyltransferase PARP12-like n=1 Tax=Cylas formicarius TaxID=197179 RepID=UPI0029588D09|nr:protein mono-ADP-ribosyltransferase PARP12-like [Cylas formicarius]